MDAVYAVQVSIQQRTKLKENTMADIAINLEASDIFGLDGSFIPQSTTATVSQAHAEMIKADGDYQKFSSVFDVLTSVTGNYTFSADTGLGTALSAFCGSVSNSYMITSVRVDTVNTEFPTIVVTGHQHTNNTHTSGNAYAIPADMIAILTGAYGAYDFGGLSGATIACIRSSYEIRLEHIDQADSTGNHWVGTNVKGLEELSQEFSGNIASPPVISGWTVETSDLNDSSEEHDTSSVSAIRIVART